MSALGPRATAIGSLALPVVIAAVAVTGVGCKRRQPPRATQIWMDEAHACARFVSNEVVCWGTYGQPPRAPRGPEIVADDDLTHRAEAAHVGDVADAGAKARATQPSRPAFAEGDVTGVAYGAEHACAALRNGSVRCWGKNANGELGDGTREKSDAPVPVHGLGDVAAVTAGAHHTCARLVNKTVSCWGRNDRHQLANGTTETSSRPVPLFGLVGVEEVVAAGDSACVRLADGDVRCWGGNDQGQLGDAARPDHDVPGSVRMPKAIRRTAPSP